MSESMRVKHASAVRARGALAAESLVTNVTFTYVPIVRPGKPTDRRGPTVAGPAPDARMPARRAREGTLRGRYVMRSSSLSRRPARMVSRRILLRRRPAWQNPKLVGAYDDRTAE